jgi:hypothetical protein
MDGMSHSMSGFDPTFAETLTGQWNHGPRVFRNALRAPLFDDRDFMTALRGAARDYIADPGARVPPGRLFLNGETVKPQQLAPLLPQSAAETCDHYVSRIVQAHPRDGIGIVLDNCEKHVPAMRDALVPILHHLFSRVGYPARRNHLCIYAGNYRSTPFGIHRDDCHVVMFCGVGRKSMAFWPRPYFDEKKELLIGTGKVSARVQDHLAEATVLEIGPLDALYWSADDWHVAVSDAGDFQAALSVGIYHHGSSAELMTLFDTLAAVTRVEGLDIPGLPGASAGRLSADDLRTAQMSGFFERWERLQNMMSRPGEVEFRALRLASRLISSAGYAEVRTPTPSATLQLAGSVLSCAVPESLTVAAARGGLLVGANGSAFFYDRAVPAIEEVVLGLRRGTPHRFDEVIGAVDAESGEIVASVIRDLVTAGALSVQPVADSATRRTGNGGVRVESDTRSTAAPSPRAPEPLQ